MGVESVCCFDDNDNEIDCNPDACDYPPCYRCYNGQMLASRGYIKTSKSGELTATGIAENCHNFKVCLPWIQEVENIIEIIKIPEFDMILIRVAFECFDLDINGCLDNPDKAWAIVIKSTARWPWFVREASSESGRLSLGSKHFDLINLENDESCGQEGEHCVQTYYYQIPGCNSLEDVNTYDIEGLIFDCYGDCSDALGEVQQFLPIVARITIQATQDNCGFDFKIDATDAVSLDMDSFLEDYITANAVFVQGDYDIGHAYLKIVVDSSIPIDHVNLLKVSSIVHHSDYSDENNEIENFEVIDCPAAAADYNNPTICFSVLLADLYQDFGDESEFLSVTVRARVEVLYTSGKRGLGNEHDLSTNIRIVDSENNEEKSGAFQLLMAIPAILFFLF